jgi:molecular chaperone HscB
MNLSDDDFTLLGLPIRLAQDPAEIDAKWRACQKQVHPDRQTSHNPQDQVMALQRSARLNQARQRLKDPLERALYLCQLRGSSVEVDGHGQKTEGQNPHAPLSPEFLMQQMQWNEELEELEGGGQTQPNPRAIEAIEAIETLLGQVQATQTSLWHQVETLLGETTETQDETQTASRLIQARQNLGQLLFLRRLVQRIKTALSSLTE